MSQKNRLCSSFVRSSAYRGRSRTEMSSFSLHWLQSSTRTLKMVCHSITSLSLTPLSTVLFTNLHVITRLSSFLSRSILRLQRPDRPDPDGSLNDVHPVTCPQPLRQLDRHLSANCSSQIPRSPSDAGAALQPRWQPHGPQCRVLWSQLSVQASTSQALTVWHIKAPD